MAETRRAPARGRKVSLNTPEQNRKQVSGGDDIRTSASAEREPVGGTGGPSEWLFLVSVLWFSGDFKVEPVPLTGVKLARGEPIQLPVGINKIKAQIIF